MTGLAAVIELAIKTGKTEGIAERTDVLYALGKLTDEEYTAILALMGVEADA